MESVLRNLWQFDFFYAVVGIYGIRSVKKALNGAKKYVEQLKDLITSEFDNRTDKLRQFFQQTYGKSKKIILNTTSLEINESRFFSTFLSKLDKNLIINKEDFSVNKNILAITPLVDHLKSKQQQGKQQLSELYERHKDKLESTRVINMEAISLYKSCVNIGLLLNVNSRKIRKAYEQALKSIGGNEFECRHILVIVAR